jgi:predicted glycosyltransferase
VPPGVSVINLPPLGHDDNFKLISHDPDLDVETACARRRDLILETFERVAPHVIVIEMYPFGRRKFEPELRPLLDAVAAKGLDRPRVVCSLRDILVNERADQASHDERVSLRANASFDAILVHADPAFTRLEASFRPATPLRVPVIYTGFVAPEAPRVSLVEPLPRVLVSAGGGMVGEPLVRAAVRAHRAVAARTGLRTTIVAGQFIPEPVWAWLHAEAAGSDQLDAIRRVDDLCLEMRRSAVSLSQCGYNSMMDLLRARVPAVVVPFAEGGEDEQRRRAEGLAALGVVRSVPADDLDGDRLVEAIVAAAGSRAATVDLDLDGQTRTARILAELVGERRTSGDPVGAGASS